MYGTHFPFGGLSGLMVFIVLGIVAYRLIKGLPEDKNGKMSPREILDERYAKGEIDTETYDEQKKKLES
ncbi:MAG: hypothetical protein C0603_07935 [Denitrovibrio sp.]|mgnify:CR=1 FL=1|nr:MAG: hypothetical protein C0603_07935 [Denitrovibrio sp.]